MEGTKLYGLDLFTGIGGITLALQEWVKPIAYCEIESYCQSLLLQRMQEKNLPKAPIWDDIRTLSTKELPRIDIIYGGSPCQDISVAGHAVGLEGKRSGLVFEIFRLLDETKAPFIFLENVPNIRTKGAERICKELSERGYDCRWCMLSARDVGARHKRERWFLLGYSEHNGLVTSSKQGSPRQTICNDKEGKNETSESKGTDTSSLLAHTKINGCYGGSCDRRDFQEKIQGRKSTITGCSKESTHSSSEGLERQCKSKRIQPKYPYISDSGGWAVEPSICRVVNGLPHRVDRIKALGNSVVPLQVREAFKLLMGCE